MKMRRGQIAERLRHRPAAQHERLDISSEVTHNKSRYLLALSGEKTFGLEEAATERKKKNGGGDESSMRIQGKVLSDWRVKVRIHQVLDVEWKL